MYFLKVCLGLNKCSACYPPVGSEATEGVLSEGYMLVRIRSCINLSVTRPSLQKTWRKNMAATFARFTQLLMIEFPYRRRSMGLMRLYMLVRIMSCIKNRNVPNLHYKNMEEKTLRRLSRVLHSFL